MAAVKKMSGIALAAAAASLLLGGIANAANPAPAATTAEAKIKCAGVNECKGKTACKSASNECKGKNSCKAKGFLEMSKAECATNKGTELKEKT